MPMALVQPAHHTSPKNGTSPRSGLRRRPITACRAWTFFNLLSLVALLSSSSVLLVLDNMHGVFNGYCGNSDNDIDDGTLGCGGNVGIGDICELCLWAFVTTLFMCDMYIKRQLMQNAREEGDTQPRLLFPTLPLVVRVLLCIKTFFTLLRSRLAAQRLLDEWLQQQSMSNNWHIVGFYDGREPVVASLLRVVRAFFCLTLTVCGLSQRTMEISQFDPERVNNEDDEDEQAETEDRVVLEERQSREEGASICEQITFSWVSKLLTAGFRAPLQITQIFLMRQDYAPMATADLFSVFWEKRVKVARAQHEARTSRNIPGGAQTNTAPFTPPKLMLVKALIIFFWKELGLSALFVLGQIATSFAQPVLLNALLKFIANPVSPDEPAWLGYALACGMVLCQFLQNILITQYDWILRNTGVRIRGALSVMIFRKAM